MNAQTTFALSIQFQKNDILSALHCSDVEFDGAKVLWVVTAWNDSEVVKLFMREAALRVSHTSPVISSPEPKAYRMVMLRRPSVVVVCRPSTISKIFFSETARPMKAKFCVEHPWVGGTKVCSRDLDHMTEMAAAPIYGKNTQKSSSPEPAGRFPRNLVCSIGDSSPSSFAQMMMLG